MASSPTLTKTYLDIADNFTHSGLSPTEQQIVLLTVSYYHKCNYCLAAHTIIAGMLKVNASVIEAIRQNKPITNKKLETLRIFTRQIVDSRGSLNEVDIDNFLQEGYSSSHILDILVGIAQKTLSNYTNHIAKTPLDKEFSDVAIRL